MKYTYILDYKNCDSIGVESVKLRTPACKGDIIQIVTKLLSTRKVHQFVVVNVIHVGEAKTKLCVRYAVESDFS